MTHSSTLEDPNRSLHLGPRTATPYLYRNREMNPLPLPFRSRKPKVDTFPADDAKCSGTPVGDSGLVGVGKRAPH